MRAAEQDDHNAHFSLGKKEKPKKNHLQKYKLNK
jgi:hypothetical protein